jgi:hypothetical protein
MKTRKIDEKLLLALHRGSVGSHPAGIYMNNHCLPIAVSHPSWRPEDGEDSQTAEAGLHALWEAVTDPEEFFESIGQRGGLQTFDDDDPPNGLWVYEVSYHMHEVHDEDDGEWTWLCCGTFRRPTPDELAPLSRGEAPWGGMVL